MLSLEPGHFPFALSQLPFLIFGICLPATAQDGIRGQLARGDAIGLVVGSVVLSLWYWAILHSVRAKRQKGEVRLLGRELASWQWAPPVALAVGLVCGGCFLLG